MIDSRVEAIIREEVLSDVFDLCPHNPNGIDAYTLFMQFDCEVSVSLEDTELGKLGYEVSDNYCFQNIRGIRGTMEERYKELCRFAEKIAPFQRTDFMDYFRSDAYSEETSAEDKIEVFSKSIGSGDDITVELLDQILSDYEVGDRIIVSDNNVFRLDDYSKELRELLYDYADFSSNDIFDNAIILFRDSLQMLHDDIQKDLSEETVNQVKKLLKTNSQRYVFREN